MAEQITIVDKKTHAKTTLNGTDVNLTSVSVVELPMRRDQVKSLARDGDSLIVTTVTGEVIVIHGFFAHDGNLKSDLVLQDDNHAFWLVDTDGIGAASSEGMFSPIDSIEPLLLHEGSDNTFLPLILGGAGAAAGGAALAFSDDDDDAPAATKLSAPTVNLAANPDGTLTVSGHAAPGTLVAVSFPDGTSATVVADASGNYTAQSDAPQTSGVVEAISIDASGNASEPTNVTYTDTGAPVAPVVDVTANENGGLTVSGTAEPGSTVTVTYPDGSTATTTADADGNYSVTTDVPQTSGEVTVTVTDEAGNTSEPTVLDYTDTGAPLAPVVDVEANEDGGLTVSGTAEPGSTVTVTYPDGSTATTTADADGNYSVTTDVPQTSGEVTVTVTDEAGNTSEPTEVSYADTGAPLAPVVEVTANPDGTVTVSGTAEPGSTVTVTYPDGTTSTTTADASGNYATSSDTVQTTGVVEATATDAAGNTSAPTDVTYTDTGAPLAPVVDVTANEDGGLTVSGTAEPGSTVTVTYPDGSTATTTADADGNYSVTTDVPQTTGTVDVTATDVAGNTSEPTEVSYTDSGAPVAPVVNVTANEDGGLTVSGTVEPGSKVTVTYPDGSTASTTADADGNYSVTTTVPQTSGEVTATATDAANNISEPAVLDYTDTGAPVAPVVNVTANEDGGLTVSGTAEPGSTVTVTYPDNSTATTTADADGNYSVTTTVPQTDGSVTATATDAANNISEPTSVSYEDTGAPVAP
ncbi:Ig-like domain-containing protein, partial [Uliginosibacterium sp. sgz301328]|uniref:Ig-like domain-containing protein n=1 Tax=Uliginosibacterium sp. sgz301328 TaxID=3243764 RepID=UPI00359E3B1F